MGNFSKQQEEKKEARSWDKTVKETLAKYFFDLSKLVFTAIVLGGFVPLFANEYNAVNWMVVGYGTLEAFLVIMAVISGGLVVWSYTKSGKKWLNSL